MGNKEQWLECITTKSLFGGRKSEQVTWVLKFSTFSKCPLTMWQLPHTWPESHLLFPLFPGTQQGELPLQPPAPIRTPHCSDLTTSLGPEVAPAFWCQAQCYPVSLRCLHSSEPARTRGRCWMLHLSWLVLISHVIWISDSVPLSSGNCFVFKTPQRIGSSIGNGTENKSKLLLCVFSSYRIYYSIRVFVCVSGWGAVSFPAGTQSSQEPVTQQVLST